MAKLSVTTACGVEGHSFSNKATLSGSERDEGGNHATKEKATKADRNRMDSRLELPGVCM